MIISKKRLFRKTRRLNIFLTAVKAYLVTLCSSAPTICAISRLPVTLVVILGPPGFWVVTWLVAYDALVIRSPPGPKICSHNSDWRWSTPTLKRNPSNAGFWDIEDENYASALLIIIAKLFPHVPHSFWSTLLIIRRQLVRDDLKLILF